jgi:hypothetical protein
MLSAEECINEFLIQVAKRKAVDYGSKASVRNFNAAYQKCFHCAKYIDVHYPNQIDLLLGLLDHNDWEVVAHCAPMILRLKNSTHEQKKRAIEAIYKLLQDPRVDDVTKLGFSLSLKQWEIDSRS